MKFSQLFFPLAQIFQFKFLSSKRVRIIPLKVKRGEHKTLNHTMWPAIEKRQCGETRSLCCWMQKGCPDSWWYTNFIHIGWQTSAKEWVREKILKNLFNFNAPRAHLEIIRSSRLGIFYEGGKEKKSNQSWEETRYSEALKREIDWLKRLRQNTFLTGESVYKTINFFFSISSACLLAWILILFYFFFSSSSLLFSRSV